MMRRKRTAVVAALAVLAATAAAAEPAMLQGRDAFGSWQGDTPGTTRLFRPQDLPKPGATASAANVSRVVQRPASAVPKVADGFKIALFAEGLSGPRIIRTAPNGDIFVAETRAGRVRVLRPSEDGSRVASSEIFADRLGHPFGIAFYPSADPQWVYVASTERVMRFPYRSGAMKASGPLEVVVPDLPAGYGHSTRDVVFTRDDKRMLVSVGSAGNVGEALGEPAGGLAAWTNAHPLGAAWGAEIDRAAVLSFDPAGKNQSLFATGIRNCVGLAIQPATGAPWCSTNERDGLGDDLVPDYVTRVKEGGFYGWPWYYMGDNPDPRHAGERPDLKGKITIPDVLLQAHSASLGLTFYDAGLFPPEYRGDAFAAEHGSWNRSKRTGYKVIRIRLQDGMPTGAYEDFVTGFVVNDREVWGRPVGVTVARDGSLLISEDGNGTIWRVSR
ncbi:sorbosone dehydrogenase family protein [Bradyrhizobium ontarionense]|uniref:Sorbosone dehydrogenase family protein n=1 Tax=Bradyrhizobium ontarionense TaxID=2898149 RepID=A0ABY3RI74_9BRAD|nr:sorbosone dehydrogenase family protein [Bradyrhizobium sp. A19]UFZ07041.1 sorbosone dehydrogenase family protein [Bradyrhizobium sp. A19]